MNRSTGSVVVRHGSDNGSERPPCPSALGVAERQPDRLTALPQSEQKYPPERESDNSDAQ
jgi:hypothetical protein